MFGLKQLRFRCYILKVQKYEVILGIKSMSWHAYVLSAGGEWIFCPPASRGHPLFLEVNTYLYFLSRGYMDFLASSIFRGYMFPGLLTSSYIIHADVSNFLLLPSYLLFLTLTLLLPSYKNFCGPGNAFMDNLGQTSHHEIP